METAQQSKTQLFFCSDRSNRNDRRDRSDHRNQTLVGGPETWFYVDVTRESKRENGCFKWRNNHDVISSWIKENRVVLNLSAVEPNQRNYSDQLQQP